ncbi:hypothetical protein [Bosea sp. NPDC055594]
MTTNIDALVDAKSGLTRLKLTKGEVHDGRLVANTACSLAEREQMKHKQGLRLH